MYFMRQDLLQSIYSVVQSFLGGIYNEFCSKIFQTVEVTPTPYTQV